MQYPNFSEEKKLWKKGFMRVFGMDEAGRGPLAGPVVAAAVIATSEVAMDGLDDSKKLSEKQREVLYEKLTADKNISWGVGIVSEKVIDKINILEATKLAMLRAIADCKLPNADLRTDYLLIDGNFNLQSKIKNQKSIVRGDAKVFSIAAASIIAKVTRDRIMRQMDKKYPQYDFAKHKGYGTALHVLRLKKFGPCKIHRASFVLKNW